MLEKELLQPILTLHEWREKYNGQNIGYGSDEYRPDQKLHYPEAYALWGKGYLKLYQHSKDKKHLERAETAAEWLKKNRSPAYRNYSWGLPFGWKSSQAELSYLITSVQVGEFLLQLHDATNSAETLDVAENVGRWVIEENGFEKTGEGVWFHYAPHPEFKIPVFSGIAKATSFLYNLSTRTGKDTYLDVIDGSVKYLLANQGENGFWAYSPSQKTNDNVHLGLHLEAMCDVYSAGERFRSLLKERLPKALDFYWTHFYRSDGFGHYVWPLTLKQTARSFIKPPIEARLQAYGAGIRVFARSSLTLGEDERGVVIANYVLQHLRRGDGAFKFRSSDDRVLLRNEAHIFDGLCSLLLALKAQ